MAHRVLDRRLSLPAVALSTVALLTSCLGVDIATKFNADGSGTIAMKLQISQMLLQMSAGEGDNPVPFTKEDLAASYEGIEGVKVESVDQTETEQDRIITSTISFKNFAAFENSKDLAGTGASLTKEGDTTIYSVLIGESPKKVRTSPAGEGTLEAPDAASQTAGEPPLQPDGTAADQTVESESPSQSQGPAGMATDEAMQQMIKGLMAGYSVSYSVTAPRPIRAHTVGVLSADGKTVSYSIKMSDFMELKEPVKFEVKW